MELFAALISLHPWVAFYCTWVPSYAHTAVLVYDVHYDALMNSSARQYIKAPEGLFKGSLPSSASV